MLFRCLGNREGLAEAAPSGHYPDGHHASRWLPSACSEISKKKTRSDKKSHRLHIRARGTCFQYFNDVSLG